MLLLSYLIELVATSRNPNSLSLPPPLCDLTQPCRTVRLAEETHELTKGLFHLLKYKIFPHYTDLFNCWFATIPERFKWQRPWRPCWMTGTIKLIRIILFMVIQHGGDDVSCKPRIRYKTVTVPPAAAKLPNDLKCKLSSNAVTVKTRNKL